MHHVSRIRNAPLKRKGLKRPPMKKEASCFTNKKHTPQTQEAQKTSDEKRDIVFYK
jgi:hypothetical protein